MQAASAVEACRLAPAEKAAHLAACNASVDPMKWLEAFGFHTGQAVDVQIAVPFPGIGRSLNEQLVVPLTLALACELGRALVLEGIGELAFRAGLPLVPEHAQPAEKKTTWSTPPWRLCLTRAFGTHVGATCLS